MVGKKDGQTKLFLASFPQIVGFRTDCSGSVLLLVCANPRAFASRVERAVVGIKDGEVMVAAQ